MNIKNIANSLLVFTLNRLIEILGIIVSIVGITLFIALFSYSPTDPNFIFPENTTIKNLLGFQGSYTSDLFFQSVGLISFLIPLSLIFTGINIFKKKEIFLIIENTFFIIIYSILGSLFFNTFYDNSYELYINGNGGFVGHYISGEFLKNVLINYENISYYFLISLTLLFFLISINFNLKNFVNTSKKIIDFTFNKKTTNYTNKNEIINEYIPQDEIKNLIQEDLPFIKAEEQLSKKTKFQIPSIDLLRIPSKEERENTSEKNSNDPVFLEKILLDFGVNGKIKKISQGPVVTLNEFEPAAGVKVSKIINLSDDIARNTSSESARISTIPGSNTIGIELPNSSRENVYLSEILENPNFKKKEIKLPIALGKNISGIPIIGDLASMPHLLIAGTTGSGKTIVYFSALKEVINKGFQGLILQSSELKDENSSQMLWLREQMEQSRMAKPQLFCFCDCDPRDLSPIVQKRLARGRSLCLMGLSKTGEPIDFKIKYTENFFRSIRK